MAIPKGQFNKPVLPVAIAEYDDVLPATLPEPEHRRVSASQDLERHLFESAKDLPSELQGVVQVLEYMHYRLGGVFVRSIVVALWKNEGSPSSYYAGCHFQFKLASALGKMKGKGSLSFHQGRGTIIITRSRVVRTQLV